jgi:hypothetical protein
MGIVPRTKLGDCHVVPIKNIGTPRNDRFKIMPFQNVGIAASRRTRDFPIVFGTGSDDSTRVVEMEKN